MSLTKQSLPQGSRRSVNQGISILLCKMTSSFHSSSQMHTKWNQLKLNLSQLYPVHILIVYKVSSPQLRCKFTYSQNGTLGEFRIKKTCPDVWETERSFQKQSCFSAYLWLWNNLHYFSQAPLVITWNVALLK